MTGQCSLAPDINSCRYYVPECAGCNAPHDGCGMLAKDVPRKDQEGYVREPRWYEKYYQK